MLFLYFVFCKSHGWIRVYINTFQDKGGDFYENYVHQKNLEGDHIVALRKIGGKYG